MGLATPSCKKKKDATETEATDTNANGLRNRPKGEHMKWKHPPTNLFSLKNVSRIAELECADTIRNWKMNISV